MGTEETNLPKLAAPARRALQGAGYTRLEDLAKYRSGAPRVLRIVASISGGRSFTCPPREGIISACASRADGDDTWGGTDVRT
jgi:hypothetical protein